MSTRSQRFLRLLREDPRYKPEAYELVRIALAYAQHELKMGEPAPTDSAARSAAPAEEEEEEAEEEEEEQWEPHLTGQQLCEAIRLYALDQYGYMAKVVLNSWGVRSTSDFGEIVYNLIRIGEMKKSTRDRREDFDDVYDFDEAFQDCFQRSAGR